jgi:hypothetical protein
MCATELEIKSSKLITLSIYRVPTGDFNQLIKNTDDALKHLYELKAEFLICRDIYRQILSLKATKKTTNSIINNIHSVAHSKFCNKNQNNSSVTIDNIFVDNSRINLASIT